MPIRPTGRGTEIVEVPPDRCLNGHALRGNATPSWQPCLCTGRNGHRIWECCICAAEVWEPEHDGRRFGQASAYG